MTLPTNRTTANTNLDHVADHNIIHDIVNGITDGLEDDLEIEATFGLILSSPNGTRYKVSVENDGSISTTVVP